MTHRRDRDTLDLFRDWTPPVVEVSFSDEVKSLASIEASRISLLEKREKRL